MPKTRPISFRNPSVNLCHKKIELEILLVCVSFYFIVKETYITQARLVFGGMAEIPKRAKHTEAFLLGKPWNQNSFSDAAGNIEKDFQRGKKIEQLLKTKPKDILLLIFFCIPISKVAPYIDSV